MTEVEQPLESIRVHRREVRRGITLPLVGGFVVFVAAIAVSVWVLYLSGRAGQLAMVANVFTTLFILLPMAVCLLPVYLLFMVAAFGTGALHGWSAKHLRRLNRLSRTITDKTIQVTELVDKRTLEARVKVAGAEALMEQAFEANEENGNNGRTINAEN